MQVQILVQVLVEEEVLVQEDQEHQFIMLQIMQAK